MKLEHSISKDYLPYKKLSLILTISFLIITAYIAFFHHTSWIVDQDGMMYLHAGEEILQGNGKNIKLFDAPYGGPIFFAFVNSFFNEGFVVMKIISLLAGSGSVYLAYKILNNVTKSRTAFLGQIFFAFHPFVGFFSIQAEIDMFPILFSMGSLYFITKKELNFLDIVFFAFFIGISFMIRTQAIVVLITGIIFLIIYSKQNFRKNVTYSLMISLIFIITISPLIYYNVSTHNVLFDHDPTFFLQFSSFHQTPEWKNQVVEIAQNGDGFLKAVFIDFDLFVKNYFHNLFYNSPNKFFNFFDKTNISLIPAIPLLSMIPMLGGLTYICKTFNKKYSKNILPLLLLPFIFCLITSVVNLNAGEQFLITWISISVISAIFFSDFIPNIILKQRIHEKKYVISSKKILIISIIVLILLSNVGYSYVMFRATSSYQAFDSVSKEIELIMMPESVIKREMIVNEIWKKISDDPDIKNSYVMTPQYYFVPYGEANFVRGQFNEGPKNDTIENYITRENWKHVELFHSNIHSIPMDRLDLNHPIPKYIIHVDRDFDGKKQHGFLKILNDPSNNEIPSNFENIYFSKEHGISVYKITNFE